MHRNFFLFEQQVKNLSPLIVGNRIKEAFTYRKNELVLHLNESEKYLHISLDIQYPYLLLGNVFKIRKPKYQFFEELRGQEIKKLSIIPHDKHVKLFCDTISLDMIFFGRTPNLNLCNQDGNLIESFKDRADLPANIADMRLDFRQSSKDDFIQLLRATSTKTIFDLLNRHFYALNKIMIREMTFRTGLDINFPIREMDVVTIEKITRIFAEIKTQMELKDVYLIHDKKSTLIRLSLFPLLHHESNSEVQTESFSDLNQAWWKFISISRDQNQRRRLYQNCREGIEKRNRFIKNALANISKAEDINQRKQEAELKGNLLLTFKNQVEPGSSKVRLSNIFSDELEEITIKLNPAKSVAENANGYFNKYKNVAEKEEIIRIKKDTLNSDFQQLQDLNKQLDAAKFPALIKLEKKLIELNIIQRQQKQETSTKRSEYSFKHYVLENKWHVYVGKNGSNNDLLSFEYAHKWDIWLHAQGVPGSHVIIRLPGKDTSVPKTVIEKAAQIAAANSKARFAATVPVIYTEVRYVSRIRKALPGTVNTRNEQVIFVKPLVIN